jgi:hypothetical protein
LVSLNVPEASAATYASNPFADGSDGGKRRADLDRDAGEDQLLAARRLDGAGHASVVEVCRHEPFEFIVAAVGDAAAELAGAGPLSTLHLDRFHAIKTAIPAEPSGSTWIMASRHCRAPPNGKTQSRRPTLPVLLLILELVSPSLSR